MVRVKMRGLLIIFVCLLAVVNGYVNVTVDYHREIGIPTATSIKQAEDRIFLRRDYVDGRIVGGNIAPPNEYPFVAGLIITFWNHPGTSACTASLIGTNRLVTAAHCWDTGALIVNQFLVVLGSQYLFYGGTRIPTNHVIVHPQWQASTLSNDVAVIYLPYNVQLSGTIQPVVLPHNSLWDSFNGEMAIAAGYGQTSDGQSGVSINSMVYHVNLRVITVQQCQAVFGPVFVQSSTLCTDGTGGIGICRGDSGGPLVINRNGQHILVGISSFVAQLGCELGFPSAFARVTSFYNFILQNM